MTKINRLRASVVLVSHVSCYVFLGMCACGIKGTECYGRGLLASVQAKIFKLLVYNRYSINHPVSSTYQKMATDIVDVLVTEVERIPT